MLRLLAIAGLSCLCTGGIMLKLLVTADLDCLCTGGIGLRLLDIGTGGIGLRLLVIASLDSFVKGVLVSDYWLLHH